MEKLCLKPIFSSNDIGKDLIFINCTLGYNGNINLLFADKTYDYLKSLNVTHYMPVGKEAGKPIHRTLLKFCIIPIAPQNYRLVVLEENKVLELNKKNINYTHALQIDDDKYCFICHSKSDSFKKFIKKNCEIYNCKGKIKRKLNLGDNINDIQTNGKHELWVSYSDSGVFFSSKLEEKGLNCFMPNGKIKYKYDDTNLYIHSCDGLNVYSDNELLVNIYNGNVESWFALSKITNKKPAKLLEWRLGSKYLAILDSKVLLQYRTENDQNFVLVDIENYDKKGSFYEFFNENNERLNCVHAQKDNLYFWTNNNLYVFSMKQL